MARPRPVDLELERVYTVVEQQTAQDSPPETRIEALVSLSDSVAAAGIEAAVVNVVFTAAERKDVLTVPVAALVALAEGGYGVEVVEGSATHYVAVQTGLFAGGGCFAARAQMAASGSRSAPLTWMIGLGADAVAAELAGEATGEFVGIR